MHKVVVSLSTVFSLKKKDAREGIRRWRWVSFGRGGCNGPSDALKHRDEERELQSTHMGTHERTKARSCDCDPFCLTEVVDYECRKRSVDNTAQSQLTPEFGDLACSYHVRLQLAGCSHKKESQKSKSPASKRMKYVLLVGVVESIVSPVVSLCLHFITNYWLVINS